MCNNHLPLNKEAITFRLFCFTDKKLASEWLIVLIKNGFYGGRKTTITGSIAEVHKDMEGAKNVVVTESALERKRKNF